MRITCLATLTVLITGAAQAAPAAPADVSEVVVTGLPEPKGDKAYDIVTLGAETLTTAPSGRLEDVLFNVAGFQQFRRSDSRAANPSSQGATLRALGGTAASRALVLLDGAPVADPFFGYIPWSALSPDRLGQVRVTRGAGAGAFGTGALTGVIEMRSLDPATAPTLQAEADYGSRNAATVSAVASGKAGGATASLFGRYDRGDGYILIAPSQRGLVDVPAAYSQGSVGLHAQAPVAANTLALVNVLAYDDQRLQGLTGTQTEAKGLDASVRLVGQGAWPWEALAYLQELKFQNTVAAVSAGRTVESPSLDEYATPASGFGGKLEVRPPIGHGGQLRLGLDLRDQSGHTSELSKYVAPSFTQLLRAGGHQRVYGGYAEWGQSLLKDVTLTAGARIDHWAIDDGSVVVTNLPTGVVTTNLHPVARDRWEPTGRGGLAWDITPGLRLRGAAYVGYRLPALAELYRPFRVGADATAPNPALSPERLRGIEAGVDLDPLPGLRLTVTAFANRLGDAIANVTLGKGPGVFPQVGFVAPGASYNQRENLTAIDARGVETEAHASLGRWRLDASYAYTHARDRASGLSAALNGLRPAQTPEHQASATLSFRPFADALVGVTGRYVSGQSEDDLGTRQLTGAATMDAVAELPVGHGVRLILRAENLTDAQVETAISSGGLITIGQPRTVWVGARVAL
jgi:vitamin B12 transporter